MSSEPLLPRPDKRPLTVAQLHAVNAAIPVAMVEVRHEVVKQLPKDMSIRDKRELVSALSKATEVVQKRPAEAFNV